MTEGQLNYRVNENAARTLESSVGFLVPHLRPGMRLLDCGCGPGSITLDLADALRPGEVVGIDHWSGVIDRARAAVEKRGTPNVRFEVGDIYELPYPEGSFDAVLTSSVVQWLIRPAAALREIFRVLKPGGVYGSRDRDRRGDLFGNANPLVRRGLNLHYWQNEVEGADLSRGGKLRPLLLKAGFENIATGASYESNSGREGARFTAANYDRVLRKDVRPDSYELIKSRGWATEDQMAAMLAAWDAWGDDERSFYCLCRVENVAWKPK